MIVWSIVCLVLNRDLRMVGSWLVEKKKGVKGRKGNKRVWTNHKRGKER